MLDEHFSILLEIQSRIAGPGPAEHMPLDTKRILDAVLALLKHATEQDRDAREMEKKLTEFHARP